MLEKLTVISQKISPNLYRIIGNTSWIVADKILRMGIGLFVGAWVARYLGSEQFGTLSYALAFTSLFSAVSNLGLDSIIVRDIVSCPVNRDEILGTAFVLRLFGSIIALLTMTGLIIVMRPSDHIVHYLVLISALSSIFLILEIIEYWFQSQVQSQYIVISKGISFLASSLFKILLIQLKAPLIWFGIIGCLEIVLAGIGLIVTYKKTGLNLTHWKFKFSRAKQLLKQSWTLILSGFVIMIYMRIDQIMLGQMIGDQAVGIYSVSVKLSELWYFVPMAITSSVYPSLIEARKLDLSLYHQRLQRLFNLMALMSYAIAIPVSFTSAQIITLVYGKGYEEGASLLTVSIWTGVFVSLGLVRSLWTTTEGLMLFALFTTAIGALINIILNFILINKYGALGAAVSTVIAQALASFISNLFFAKTRFIFFSQLKALIMPFSVNPL